MEEKHLANALEGLGSRHWPLQSARSETLRKILARAWRPRINHFAANFLTADTQFPAA